MNKIEELVIDKLINYLNKNKIKYQLDTTDYTKGLEFTIFKGKEIGDIYLEEIISEDDIKCTIQTLDKDSVSDYIIHEEIDSIDYNTLEQYISELIEKMTIKGKIIPKISSKLIQISQFAEELGLTLDEVLKYNF